ncbi:MAG: hypothetical protein COB97_09665 [Paracoccus sp.]|nr:MAG: hypothetical protein COB97_09665 [Paracoccus sp. (in: a-proteobacteria)]
MIAGKGLPIDAVVADFLSGAVELLSPDNTADHWDVIEGQGCLFHPGYGAVSMGLLIGSQPDAFVVCTQAGDRGPVPCRPDKPFQPVDGIVAVIVGCHDIGARRSQKRRHDLGVGPEIGGATDLKPLKGANFRGQFTDILGSQPKYHPIRAHGLAQDRLQRRHQGAEPRRIAGQRHHQFRPQPMRLPATFGPRRDLGQRPRLAAAMLPRAERRPDHGFSHALRSQPISPMRRYHLWPRPAKTSSIFGAPANSTIFAPSGRVGSRR